MGEQRVEIRQVVGKPIRAADPSRQAEAAPVGRDDAPITLERIHQKLKAGRDIHPAVEQEQARRMGRSPQPYVIAQSPNRQKFRGAALHGSDRSAQRRKPERAPSARPLPMPKATPASPTSCFRSAIADSSALPPRR